MNYKELLQQLQQLSEEQLSQRVVLYDTFGGENESGEYYSKGIEFVFASEECDVLDVDHPIIRF